jgi:hypothetical protein
MSEALIPTIAAFGDLALLIALGLRFYIEFKRDRQYHMTESVLHSLVKGFTLLVDQDKRIDALEEKLRNLT